MLLSYANNNIDNNRVMIDDFADQDWFAESDEITSGVIQKNPAILDDQHQFHNVPHQSLQQQNTNVDYLDLNVPVDENVFYSSNGEQSITASTSHYLEVRGEQNISNIGTQIIQSTNSSSVIYNETKGNSIGFQTNQQPLPLLTNFGRDYGTARAQASVMTVPQIRQEPNDGKSTYIDCIPSTSLATLKPYTQEQSQVCQSQIQQLQHPPQQQYYYEQRIFQNEQQQHTQHLPQSFNDHQHQPSSFQLPPNYQPPPEQIIGHQPLNTSNAVFSSNQLSQQCNTVESVSVKTVAKKSTKTRRRPSISNQSTNKLINGYEQQTETSSGLDQVAKSLFSNQKTATLEFADPQLAMEFASLMGRCQQLEEQKKSGIDVTSELKIVMDRIADCIVRNTTTSAIKAAQQEQQYASSLSGQFEAFPSTSTISQFPSNNKPAKSRAPRKKPNVAKKSQLPSSVQTSTIITPNSVQQSKAQINSQTFIKQSTDSLSTSTPVQFVAFNPTTQSHPSTYTSSTILANNVRQSNSLQIESSKEEKIISVLVPTTNSSSDNMIYAKRNMRVIAQENEKLIAEKLEKQKEKRRERTFCQDA
uniref:Uncharacterized protein n=1 Tax=Meloidogyne javanica TaxID=6303 RepID=A0A915MK13_MELJA